MNLNDPMTWQVLAYWFLYVLVLVVIGANLAVLVILLFQRVKQKYGSPSGDLSSYIEMEGTNYAL